MPLPALPRLPTDGEILSRIAKILAAGARLPDPGTVKVTQALRDPPFLYQDNGLRLLAGELLAEFRNDSLLLTPDQLVAVNAAGSPEVVTVGKLCDLVRQGLVHCRLQRVILAVKSMPDGTPVSLAAKLRLPPLGFADGDLAALADDLNRAMAADRLALPPARVTERDPVTGKPMIENVQALCELMLKSLP